MKNGVKALLLHRNCYRIVEQLRRILVGFLINVLICRLLWEIRCFSLFETVFIVGDFYRLYDDLSYSVQSKKTISLFLLLAASAAWTDGFPQACSK